MDIRFVKTSYLNKSPEVRIGILHHFLSTLKIIDREISIEISKPSDAVGQSAMRVKFKRKYCKLKRNATLDQALNTCNLDS